LGVGGVVVGCDLEVGVGVLVVWYDLVYLFVQWFGGEVFVR